MKKSLSRKERLAGKRKIDELFKQAKRVEAGGLRLCFQPNGGECNRIVVTTRRGFRTAVARNRAKRILREVYRNNKSGIKQGFDLAFILLNEESSFSKIMTSFLAVCDRAKLINSESGDE